MRENVDYNALMEKQSVLKLSITRLEAELRRARIITAEQVSTDVVSIGCVVAIEDVAGGDHRSYTILGPWDADMNIISLRTVLRLPVHCSAESREMR